MAKNKKTEAVTPLWLKVAIPILTIFAGAILFALIDIIGLLNGIQANTNRLSSIETSLVIVEERTQDIEGIKLDVKELLWQSGIVEITPTKGGTLITYNVEIEIPPNSVSEPIISTVRKIPSSSLPSTLPDKDYVFSDGIDWFTGGLQLASNASILWGLAPDTNCEGAEVLYWNGDSKMWQKVPPESCDTASRRIGFNAQTGGYYVLVKKAE